MPKHEKSHRFLSESSSSSRSRSKSHSRRRSSSREESRKKHKKQHHDRKKHHSGRHRKRSYSSSKSSSRSRDRKRSDRPRNKKQEREKRRREEEREDARFKYPEPPKEDEKPEEPPVEVEKPSFIRSGILAEYSNNVNGITLKFTEPLDAKKPDENWRIFPFKGDEELPIIHLTKQSVYLFGKDPEVADILIEHPTCSGQHAVIQFREIKSKNNRGELSSLVKPYLMDLESKNGTFLNSQQIEPARYYELLPQDVIKFANSSRDYVVMKDE